MLLCRNCINEIRSRGELIQVLEPCYISIEDCEEFETVCEWCGEADDLHLCNVHVESGYLYSY